MTPDETEYRQLLPIIFGSSLTTDNFTEFTNKWLAFIKAVTNNTNLPSITTQTLRDFAIAFTMFYDNFYKTNLGPGNGKERD